MAGSCCAPLDSGSVFKRGKSEGKVQLAWRQRTTRETNEAIIEDMDSTHPAAVCWANDHMLSLGLTAAA